MGYKAEKVEFIRKKWYIAICKAVVHRGEHRIAESPVQFRATCIMRIYHNGMSFLFYQKEGDGMAGIDNLRTPTTEEARAIGRKGGLASGQKRREKKTMSSLATMMINAQLSGENKAKIKKQFGILEDDDITIASAMMAGQIKAAMAGDSS